MFEVVEWTPCGLEVEETGEGLEVDSMDEMGTAGELHEDLWGSVRYSNKVAIWDTKQYQ